MSASYESLVFQALFATLAAAQASGQPLNFVAPNSIFAGLTPDIINLPPGSYPAISLEPASDDEKFFTTGTPPELSSGFKVEIHCLVQEADSKAGIIGDATLSPPVTGLLDLVAAVKNVVQKDMTLGGVQGLQKALFTGTRFEYAFYPIRIAVLTVLFTGQFATTAH
jgi:hypothetical protein